MDNKEKIELEESVKKASEITNIPVEIINGFLVGIPGIFTGGFEKLSQRSVIFSRWCLAGSVTATFTVLISIREMIEVYSKWPVKLFIVFQFFSILFGLIHLFKAEIKEAVSKSVEEKMDIYKVLFAEVSKLKAYEDFKTKADALRFEGAIQIAIEKFVKHLVSAKFLAMQTIGLFFGLCCLIYPVMFWF